MASIRKAVLIPPRIRDGIGTAMLVLEPDDEAIVIAWTFAAVLLAPLTGRPALVTLGNGETCRTGRAYYVP